MEVGFGATLLIGGARSGKSNMALQLGLTWGGAVCFVATATAQDDDMSARIAGHQDERPSHWELLERPEFGSSDVPDGDDELLIVDCITMLVANLIFADHTDDGILNHAVELATALDRRRGPSIVVTNEVGLGVHPETPLGRRYRDTLGRVNRALAERAETSLLVVAGKVVPLETLSLQWPQETMPVQAQTLKGERK